MFNEYYYKTALIGLSIILCASLMSIMWYMTNRALSVDRIPIVQEAAAEVNANLHYAYETQAEIDDKKGLIDAIVNYDI